MEITKKITKVKPKKLIDLLSLAEEVSLEPTEEQKYWTEVVNKCNSIGFYADISLDEIEQYLDEYLTIFPDVFDTVSNKKQPESDYSILSHLKNSKVSQNRKKKILL